MRQNEKQRVRHQVKQHPKHHLDVLNITTVSVFFFFYLRLGLPFNWLLSRRTSVNFGNQMCCVSNQFSIFLDNKCIFSVSPSEFPADMRLPSVICPDRTVVIVLVSV